MSKKTLIQIINYILVVLGTFLLSFGAVIFMTECELVTGGVSGIAIIIQHFVPGIQIYDYLVAGIVTFFWLMGLIFVGKDFAIKTLLSSILYIGFTFLFKRVDFFTELAKTFAGTLPDSATPDVIPTPTVGNYMLCGIFGGVFVGGGVALTFVGGGSTGGVDVIQVLMNKHLKIKESVSSFFIDATVIIIGMATMQLWIPALCGILSAFMTAALIEVVYIRSQTSYQVDIISKEWQKISEYAQNELERGATIIHAEGGYKGEERIILRVVFPKYQYEKLRDYIASVDSSAFVTITQTNAVYGEGFQINKNIRKNKKK